MPSALVVGLRDVDAGKTTLATALLARLRLAGEDPAPLKPWSATDTWVFHDDVAAGVEAGRLVSRDARRLVAAAGSSVDPGTVNPVHRVWAPVPARRSPEARSAPVLDRVVDADGEVLVVHPDARVPGMLAPLLAAADDVRRPQDWEAMRRISRELHIPAVQRAWERASRASWTVVEGYADVAAPPGLPAADVVLAAEPFQAHRFDGARWHRALELVQGMRTGTGSVETPAARLLSMVEPETTVEVPALASAVRRDPRRAAEAYSDALEALVPELGR